MYQELRSRNNFWHVPQTCPDVGHATVSPPRFLGVDQELGTCASGNDNSESDIRIILVNAEVGVRDDEVVPSVVESEGYQGYLGFHE